jgi:hypothetical protein
MSVGSRRHPIRSFFATSFSENLTFSRGEVAEAASQGTHGGKVSYPLKTGDELRIPFGRNPHASQNLFKGKKRLVDLIGQAP